MNPIARPRTSALALIVLLAGASSGCSLAQGTPTPTTCNGISSELGGCAADLPTFTGTSCDQLADEFGPAMDAAVMKVIHGPKEANGERQSVRLTSANIVITTLATNRMIELGIIEDCKMPAFLDRAALGFSPELKSQVGTVVYDNDPPAGYGDWIAILTRIMGGIGKPST
jgi:hypothetical protein